MCPAAKTSLMKEVTREGNLAVNQLCSSLDGGGEEESGKGLHRASVFLLLKGKRRDTQV